MTEYIHIGSKIEGLLEEKHMTKRELGLAMGMSPSSAVHLTTRANVDVQLLHKVGNVLKYNFFKHFPIDEGKGTDVADLSREKQLSA